MATAFLLQACFTGIEGTREVTLSRQDKLVTAPTAEDTLLNQLGAIPLREWPLGKPFVASANRTLLAFDQQGIEADADSSAFEGTRLAYAGTELRQMPDGSSQLLILFSDGSRTFRYPTRRSPEQALEEVRSDALSMIIDPVTVARADEILRGRRLWNRKHLCYLPDGSTGRGGKFQEVRVDSVTMGDMLFPLRVWYTVTDPRYPDQGASRFVKMSTNVTGKESRSFASQFCLSDPRLRYPKIDSAVWDKICRGEVAEGMTKEETRLAWGSPSDADSGHNWSQTLDVWHFPDGHTVYFRDGVVSTIR